MRRIRLNDGWGTRPKVDRCAELARPTGAGEVTVRISAVGCEPRALRIAVR